MGRGTSPQQASTCSRTDYATRSGPRHARHQTNCRSAMSVRAPREEIDSRRRHHKRHGDELRMAHATREARSHGRQQPTSRCATRCCSKIRPTGGRGLLLLQAFPTWWSRVTPARPQTVAAMGGHGVLPGGSYPASYNGGLFFADHSRRVHLVHARRENGVPIRCTCRPSSPRAAIRWGGRDLGGDLFYADLEGGSIHRIRYTATNQPPVASFTTQPTAGPTPLTCSSTAAVRSREPKSHALTSRVGPRRERCLRQRNTAQV